MTFDRWDVILTRFPFVDRSREKLRPVVVLSSSQYNAAHDLLIVVMITSATEGNWSSDVEIIDLRPAGLKHRCFVRWKLATLSTALAGRRLGAISGADRQRLHRDLLAIMPLEGAD